MKLIYFLTFPILLTNLNLKAQDSAYSCKVEMSTLNKSYTGDCKRGYAHGQGEAKGIHKYIGAFQNGWPTGKGIYYYNDSNYHSGIFLEGLKEGKGETHYVRTGLPDSVIKGYWSGD